MGFGSDLLVFLEERVIFWRVLLVFVQGRERVGSFLWDETHGSSPLVLCGYKEGLKPVRAVSVPAASQKIPQPMAVFRKYGRVCD